MFEQEVYKRMLVKYNSLIDELEKINEEYKKFIEVANKDPENPKVVNLMLVAKENLRRLQVVKAERDLLLSKIN